MQIGDKENIFLVDMKALNESQVLDDLLIKVFDNPNINIIGMSFHCDLGELAKGAPKLKFFKKIENLYDVQPMFAALYKKPEGQGLSKIVDAIIGKKVCKVEQMANWELRPLRQSQQHYSALDSYILVGLFEQMKKYAEENDIRIEDYKNSYVLGDTSGKAIANGTQLRKDEFNLHTQNIGKASIKTIRLKAGQGMAPNGELAHSEKTTNFSFCVDHNLNRLTKLFKHFGLEAIKLSKKCSAIERCKCPPLYLT